MTVDASSKGRSTTLVWGGAAAACLVGVLLVWLSSAAASERALFGSTGSRAVVGLALVGTVLGLVVALTARRASAAVRWGLALPLAICAGAVGTLAFGAFFAPSESTDVGVGALLGVGAIGLIVVAARVSRGGPA
jgi:hypothetical protein